MAVKACSICKRLLTKDTCPVCNTSKLVDNWKGKVIILNPEKSEIAKKLKIKEAGVYALRL